MIFRYDTEVGILRRTPRRVWIAGISSAIAALPKLARAAGQNPPEIPEITPHGKRDEIRLPNGRKQSDEILKLEFQKNMDDARELAALSRSVQEELEKDDRFVLSLATLKKLDDIEKITRRIRSRLKH